MKLTVASSPHIRGNFRTNRIMLDVMIALTPALAVGVVRFGMDALILLSYQHFLHLQGVLIHQQGNFFLQEY